MNISLLARERLRSESLVPQAAIRPICEAVELIAMVTYDCLTGQQPCRSL